MKILNKKQIVTKAAEEEYDIILQKKVDMLFGKFLNPLHMAINYYFFNFTLIFTVIFFRSLWSYAWKAYK